MTYNGIRVKSGNTITVGQPLGIITPTFNIEKDELYTLQFKICNKTPHNILNYIYVGNQNLGNLDLTSFKTTEVIEEYQEKLCFIEFIANETATNVSAKIGRLQDSNDIANVECFLIREIQFEKGSMTDYKPNHGDNSVELEMLQTQINQTSSEISIMAKKTELDKLGDEVSNAMASISIQAGLIESKVSEGDFSTLIRQSPTDIQYSFNGINPRYQYTDDGFYMYHENGNIKASFKRGSFYTYNYTDGTFLGGLTPFVLINDSSDYNAGQGIINTSNSHFFTIGKDSTLQSDIQDVADNFISYMTLNFRDRGSEQSQLYGLHLYTPFFLSDDLTINGNSLKKCHYVTDIEDNEVFQFTNTDAFNSKNWNWNGKNIYNAVWVDASDRTLKENIEYEKDTSKYYNFIKDDYVMARYNYIGDSRTKISAIAQDLMVNLDGTDNEVGQLMVNCKDFMEKQHPVGIDQNQLLNVTVGALQEAIKKIEALENEIKLLKNINIGEGQ